MIKRNANTAAKTPKGFLTSLGILQGEAELGLFVMGDQGVRIQG